MAAVADLCSSFCLDNGAFSLWKSGTPVDWDDYVRWVKEWDKHPAFDFALIPDVIGGTEKQNKELIVRYRSAFKNAVPVFHLHESDEYAAILAGLFGRIAIGSSGEYPTPGTDSWWVRMGRLMEVLCDGEGKPKCKLHGLRMMNPKIFTRLPLSSADSTNATVNSGALKRFGSYPAPSRALRAEVIAARIEHHQSAPLWQKHYNEDPLVVEYET